MSVDVPCPYRRFLISVATVIHHNIDGISPLLLMGWSSKVPGTAFDDPDSESNTASFCRFGIDNSAKYLFAGDTCLECSS